MQFEVGERKQLGPVWLFYPASGAVGIPEMARRLMVRTALGGQVDRMLDGGPCRWGLESTIVSLLNA